MGALCEARQLARSRHAAGRLARTASRQGSGARHRNYTQDEQRTEFTLWAISRSPLILGANLTKLDDFTRSLITNKEVLDINQNAVESEPGLVP